MKRGTSSGKPDWDQLLRLVAKVRGDSLVSVRFQTMMVLYGYMAHAMAHAIKSGEPESAPEWLKLMRKGIDFMRDPSRYLNAGLRAIRRCHARGHKAVKRNRGTRVTTSKGGRQARSNSGARP